MHRYKILIVEDDLDTSDMLRIYFEALGYEVFIAAWGGEALEICQKTLLNLVILDIRLPDIDGYEIATRLRDNLRTSHIPFIFLTEKREREDKIAGLKLGAVDYITKPFDVQELRLIVRNALRRAEYESLVNSITGLPGSRLVEEQLERLLFSDEWGLLYIGLKGLRSFNEVYGFVAGDDVLRFTAMVTGEAVDELGTPDDFIGQTAANDFIVITTAKQAQAIKEKVKDRFAAEMGTFYNFKHREQGYITVQDPDGQEKQVPLMTLAVGSITQDDGPFADIREIAEKAAEARREG